MIIKLLFVDQITLASRTKPSERRGLVEPNTSKYLDNDLKTISDRKKNLSGVKLNCEQIYNTINSKKNALKRGVESFEKELELMYKMKEDKLNQMLGKDNNEDAETLESVQLCVPP